MFSTDVPWYQPTTSTDFSGHRIGLHRLCLSILTPAHTATVGVKGLKGYLLIFTYCTVVWCSVFKRWRPSTQIVSSLYEDRPSTTCPTPRSLSRLNSGNATNVTTSAWPGYVTLHYVTWSHFLARDNIAHMQSEYDAIARLSVRLSITRVSQSNTAEVRIMQFSPYDSLPISLVFAG